MNLEQELHAEMITAYHRAGKEIGYWGNYYLRSVKRNGGLATAKRMLRPATKGQIHKGLQALIDAGRPDLSLEKLVLDSRFKSLFSTEELREAENRLKAIPERRDLSPEEIFPETLLDDRAYFEGGRKRIVVNSYERDRRAREACIKKHGIRCTVCRMSFEEVYGELGRGFIHIHHKKPLAMTRTEYQVDPLKDLIPVCPNCHAMLHKKEPPLSINELREVLQKTVVNKCR